MTEATTPSRTQEQRRSDARERLIRAAGELIADGGLTSLTLASVGERAGYSRGIANHHFGTKAHLVHELIARVEGEFIAATSPDLSRPVEATEQVTRAFFALLADLPDMHRAFLVLWAAAASGDDELRTRMAASDESFRKGLAAAVRTTRPKSGVDADAASAMIVGLLRGVALQHLLATGSIDLDAVQAATVTAIRRLLA